MENLTAIILAGGKSSRMGSDKGLLPFRNKLMAQHVIDVAKEVAGDIIIVSNNGQYHQFGLPVYPDLIKDCGPMAGIYTGLCFSNTTANLVLSCDTPLVEKSLLVTLSKNFHENLDALVPFHSGKAEPLCAIYNRGIKELLFSLIQQKELKMQEMLNRINCKFFNLENSLKPERWFININTLAELAGMEKED
jgi:molybdenum cofactor guanylyltransferase